MSAARAGDAGPILELEDIHTYYGSIHALKGVSLDVQRGRDRHADRRERRRQVDDAALDQRAQPPAHGHDHASRASDITNDAAARRREDRHRAVAGGPAAVPAHDACSRTSRWARSSAPTARGIKEDIDRVFELFPRLAERRTQKAGTLSGGEQQMCRDRPGADGAAEAADARRAVDGPRADLRRADLRDRSIEINEQGTPILLVEQNALMALDVASRGYVLETGHDRARRRREDAPRERAGPQDLPRRDLDGSHAGQVRCRHA